MIPKTRNEYSNYEDYDIARDFVQEMARQKRDIPSKYHGTYMWIECAEDMRTLYPEDWAKWIALRKMGVA